MKDVLTCWWCGKRFFASEAKKAKDSLLVCPNCSGWTGNETEEDNKRNFIFNVYDPKKGHTHP